MSINPIWTFLIPIISAALLASEAAGAEGGLTGRYFANSSLAGEPVVKRIDPIINFSWSTGSPDAALPVDHFSVQWTGCLAPQQSGVHVISLETDDGCRLWFDGKLLIDDWTAHAPKRNTVSVSMMAGRAYPIRIEYFERTGGAVARLRWSAPGLSEQIIPTSSLKPETDVMLHLPASSFVSPICLEGFAPNGADAAVVRAWGRRIPLTKLSEGAFFVNMPLHHRVPTLATVHGPSRVENATLIHWQAIDLANTPTSEMEVRIGDSLLFASDVKGELVINENCGGRRIKVNKGSRTPVLFDAPGWHSVSLVDQSDTPVGSISVLAIGHGMLGELAGRTLRAKVGAERNYRVPMLPAAEAGRVNFFTSTSRLSVATGDATDGLLSLRFKPLARGYLAIGARLGRTGSILGSVQVEEYEVIYRNRINAPVEDFDANGNSIALTQIEMRPFIPGVRFDFAMFASKSKFEGGGKTLSAALGQEITSAGTPGWRRQVDASGEEYAVLDLRLLVPRNENRMCYNTTIYANLP